MYEIYKVGQALHWEEGLDLLGPFGLELAIVPHWDNAEGGTHDTRACFMGAARFARLKAMLPPTAVVMGIDEHTAVTIDITSSEAQVRGRGGVTVARADRSSHYAAGERFPLIELMASSAATSRLPETPTVDEPPSGLDPLTLASAQIAAGDLASALRIVASAAPSDLAPVLLQAACAATSMPEAQSADRLLSLLVETRDALRQAHLWELADCLRDRLGELGVDLQDTPTGTDCKKLTRDS